jgi:hypothetical protein
MKAMKAAAPKKAMKAPFYILFGVVLIVPFD